MFEAFKIPISWAELGKRTGKEAIDDNVSGLAAELAYYFFLALFPALLFLVAIASFFPVRDLMNQVVEALARFAPGEVLGIVRDQVAAIAGGKNGGLLTFGFIGTLWSTSSAITGIISTLNTAYEITESRPWWKVRLIAIALTFAVGLFILISFALVVAGPSLAGPVADWLGLGRAFEITWQIVQWPIVFLLVVSGIGMIYYFGPDAEQRWEWVTPGSLLATVLWLLGSLGFRWYVTAFGNFNATYGAIGGVIVALLWLYLSGWAILLGAELNAEIEHASPWGKEKGEKRPGERKKLGRLAAAAYEARQKPGQAKPDASPASGRILPNISPRPAAGQPRVAPVFSRAGLPAGSPRGRRLGPSDLVFGGIAMLAVAIRTFRRKVGG